MFPFHFLSFFFFLDVAHGMALLPNDVWRVVVSYCTHSAVRNLGFASKLVLKAVRDCTVLSVQGADTQWCRGFGLLMQDVGTFQELLLSLRYAELCAFQNRFRFMSSLAGVGRILWINTISATESVLLVLDIVDGQISLLHFTNAFVNTNKFYINDMVYYNGMSHGMSMRFSSAAKCQDALGHAVTQYRGGPLVLLYRFKRAHSLHLLHLTILVGLVPITDRVALMASTALCTITSLAYVQYLNTTAEGRFAMEVSPTPPMFVRWPLWPLIWLILLLTQVAKLPSSLEIETSVYSEFVFATHRPLTELGRAVVPCLCAAVVYRLRPHRPFLALLFLGYRFAHLRMMLVLWALQLMVNLLLLLLPQGVALLYESRLASVSHSAAAPRHTVPWRHKVPSWPAVLLDAAWGPHHCLRLLEDSVLQAIFLHGLALVLPYCSACGALVLLLVALLPDAAAQICTGH